MSLFTTAQTARILTRLLGVDRSVRAVQYLIDMGELEASHLGVDWRIWPHSVEEYAQRKGSKGIGNFTDYPLDSRHSDVLFLFAMDDLSGSVDRANVRVEGRKRRVEYSQGGPKKVPQQKIELSPVQMELDLSA